MYPIIGVCIVSLTLIQHGSFIFSDWFITLVAPVTGVATLGFSIAMEESTTGNGSASSLLGLVQFLFGGIVTPLVNVKGEYNSMPYLTIIISAIVILVILHLINFKVFKTKR